MEPGWHTYWKNTGSAGARPQKIEWQLPAVGVIAGEIQWPAPGKNSAGGGITTAIQNEVV